MEKKDNDEIGGICPESCMMVSRREEIRWGKVSKLRGRLQTRVIKGPNDLAVQSIRAEITRTMNGK